MPKTYTSPEERIVLSFRTFLDAHLEGELLHDVGPHYGFLSHLERFIPSKLGEKYEDWGPPVGEGLDGFEVHKALKTGDLEAEILGVCVLITDMALVPFLLRLRIDRSEDRIKRLEFYVGEMGEEGLKRKYKDQWKLFYGPDTPEPDWAYTIIYEDGKVR